VTIPAVIIIRGDVSRFGARLDNLAQYHLIRSNTRSAPVPNATGMYWFYAFYRDPQHPPNLLMCKERVRISPSTHEDFDFEYRTIPSQSACGVSLPAWHGAFVYSEEYRAFLDYSRDEEGPDTLIGYLPLPYLPGQSLAEFDSIGFEMGPADYGVQPVMNAYVLSARDIRDEAEVMRLIQNGVQTRMAVAGQGSTAHEVSCTTRDVQYGNHTMSELRTCRGDAPLNVYSVIVNGVQ